MGIYGLYITLGVLLLALALLLLAIVKPHLKKYRLELKQVHPKKKVRRKPKLKKKKNVWIKIA